LDIGILVAVGLAVGLVGGMFGVGGAIVLIPALTEVLGPDQHLYQATAMILNLFVALPAVYQHHAAKAVDFRLVGRIAPLALVAVLGGVAVSELHLFAGSGEAYLRGLFGLFLFACASYEVYRLSRRGRPSPADVTVSRESWRAHLLVAIPTGFSSGLLGVGGGILAVPLLRRFVHLPIRQAIANSAAIIVGVSLVGAIVKNLAYAADPAAATGSPLTLAAVLIPTAIAGSLVGSRLTHILPTRLTRVGFIVLLLISSVRMMQSAVPTILAAQANGR